MGVINHARTYKASTKVYETCMYGFDLSNPWVENVERENDNFRF